jgi:hypothetical protein
MLGPRATSTFLVLTALVFAVLLSVIAWQSRTAGSAVWLVAAGLVVAAAAVILAIVFARGVGEGRL